MSLSDQQIKLARLLAMRIYDGTTNPTDYCKNEKEIQLIESLTDEQSMEFDGELICELANLI